MRKAARRALLKRFESPDETRTFEKGRFDLVTIGRSSIGRARYEPGWKWSLHVGPLAKTASCEVEHVGLVLSGRAAVKMDDGREIILKAGDLFFVPKGHDSWVLGRRPYVSLHFLGAERYAARPAKRKTPSRRRSS
jgi:mannose-6-phosphate isomerase-like protein (cupin superfamily)